MTTYHSAAGVMVDEDGLIRIVTMSRYVKESRAVVLTRAQARAVCDLLWAIVREEKSDASAK